MTTDINKQIVLLGVIFFGTICSVFAEEIDALVVRPTLIPPKVGMNTLLEDVYVVNPNSDFIPPKLTSLPNNAYGDLIKQGRNLFVDTQRYAARYVGNGLNCSHCHLGEGRQPKASPMWGAYGMYPQFREKNNQIVTFEERIQSCFKYSLDGIAPTLDSPEMRALVSYSQWLSTGVPNNTKMAGRGFAFIKKSRDPDMQNGKVLYQVHCAMCHGVDGLGEKHINQAGYMFPPLWGSDSYNRGAGFQKTKTLAKFIRANMPLGAPYSLNMDQSLEIAAYIWIQYRPYDPRKSFLKNSFVAPEAGQN